jgi:hypothetical protein
MNNIVKKYGLMIGLIVLMFSISGCVTQAAQVTFRFNGEKLSSNPGSSQTMVVQYSDGTSINSSDSSAISSEDGSASIIAIPTKIENWFVGAYINEGNINWVPSLDFNRNGTELKINVAGIALKKPTIAAAYAELQGPIVPYLINSVDSGYVSVTFAVYGSDEESLVDGQTAVFAHTDKNIKFYNNDPNDITIPDDSDPDNNYTRTDYVSEGIASYTQNGLVTFVIESNSTDISSLPLQLYSGTTKIYNSLDNTLSALSLSSGELTPAFEAGTTSYTASVPYSTTSLTVTASVYESTSVAMVNGNTVTSGHASNALTLNVGENPIAVEVSAQNGTAKTYTVAVTRAAAPSSSSTPSSSESSGPTIPSKVNSTNGQLTIPIGTSGEVSLGDEVLISIPADASLKELNLTIDKITNTQSLLTTNQVLLSPIFEVLKNFTENFSKPVTLSFNFDSASVKNNQTVAVFYYDESKQEWVKVEGGKMSGNRISVEVNHFTKYAVFAVDLAAEIPPTDSKPTINFSDITGHWAEASIKQAVTAGIISGYPDGTFMPSTTVTRAEFAVMLMNTLKPQGEGTTLTFTDTAKIGAWAQKAVAQAVQSGIINGYEDGSFRPSATMTRSEMAAMIANALKLSIEVNASTQFADDKDIPVWAKGAVAALKETGIVEGTGTNKFNPSAPTTRAEAVIVLLNMLQQINN